MQLLASSVCQPLFGADLVTTQTPRHNSPGCNHSVYGCNVSACSLSAQCRLALGTAAMGVEHLHVLASNGEESYVAPENSG